MNELSILLSKLKERNKVQLGSPSRITYPELIKILEETIQESKSTDERDREILENFGGKKGIPSHWPVRADEND